ncbi:MAG: hypothetical protein BMS9Abin33_0817 [Gammaproteobacteria bacterium]|nr:MAG: hypothetical protein BMS9Abin33_0817 [Gammaproteobacteria bacterium]
MKPGEHKTVQARILKYADEIGWTVVYREEAEARRGFDPQAIPKDRAVYTVKFEGYVYVLHCFQKKSKKGIATPKPDMDRIRARLKDAELLHLELTR